MDASVPPQPAPVAVGRAAHSHTGALRPRRVTGLLAPLAALLGVQLVALGAAAQSVVSASPDITIQLGSGDVVTSDEAVAADNQLGIVALQSLGGIPSSADVTGYADAGGGTFYFSLDTTVSLSGGSSPAPPTSSPGTARAMGSSSTPRSTASRAAYGSTPSA